jgi:hypothetical protein
MVRGQEELQRSQMDFRDANRPQVAARHAPDCEPSWVAYRTEHIFSCPGYSQELTLTRLAASVEAILTKAVEDVASVMICATIAWEHG